MKSLKQMDIVIQGDGTLLTEFVQMETYILDSIAKETFDAYFCDSGAMPFMACLDIAAPDTLSMDLQDVQDAGLDADGLARDPKTFEVTWVTGANPPTLTIDGAAAAFLDAGATNLIQAKLGDTFQLNWNHGSHNYAIINQACPATEAEFSDAVTASGASVVAHPDPSLTIIDISGQLTGGTFCVACTTGGHYAEMHFTIEIESTTVFEDRLLELSWKFAAGNTIADTAFDPTGAVALNQTYFPKAKYGTEDISCQNKTHGDGVITALDMVILLWNQFLIPPYNKELQDEWYFIRTVEGEDPSQRCGKGTGHDWDYGTYYERYFANIAGGTGAFCPNQLNAERVSGDTYRRLLEGAPPQTASRAVLREELRRLAEVPTTFVYDSAKGIELQTFRHGIVDGGVWFHIHIPVANFAFDIILDGIATSQRIALSNQPAPYNTLDLAPLDPSQVEVRFSRYDSDAQGALGQECASVMGALTSGIALYGNRLAMQQMPSPRRHRLCRYDVFIYMPFSSSAATRRLSTSSEEPCEVSVTSNSVLMASSETKVTKGTCIPRTRKAHLELTRTTSPPPPPVAPSPSSPSPLHPPPPSDDDDDFPLVPVIIGAAVGVVLIIVVLALVAGFASGRRGSTPLLVINRATTAPAADANPVSVTNASGVAGSKKEQPKEPKEADAKPQAPKSIPRAGAGAAAAPAARAGNGAAAAAAARTTVRVNRN